MAILCRTFRELDSSFQATLQRACNLKNSPSQGGLYDDWKSGIGVEERDLSEFDRIMKEDKTNLEYIQDVQILRFWTLAMNFMEFEMDGYPGRRTPHGEFPAPNLAPSGWVKRIDQVQSLAMHLLLQVLNAAKDGSLQDIDLFTGVHKRIVKLDSFLDRTNVDSYVGTPRLSVASEIDRLW